jgi:HK97 family phage prohead protease
MWLLGVAYPWNTWLEKEDLRFRYLRGAFASVLRSGSPIRLLVNHNPAETPFKLSTANDAFRVFEHDDGLRFAVNLDTAPGGEQILNWWITRFVTGVSVGPRSGTEAIKTAEGYTIISVESLDEISLTIWPGVPAVRETARLLRLDNSTLVTKRNPKEVSMTENEKQKKLADLEWELSNARDFPPMASTVRRLEKEIDELKATRASTLQPSTLPSTLPSLSAPATPAPAPAPRRSCGLTSDPRIRHILVEALAQHRAGIDIGDVRAVYRQANRYNAECEALGVPPESRIRVPAEARGY